MQNLKPLKPYTCITLINQCKNLVHLKALHACMLRSHLHLNVHFLTRLITHYFSLNSPSHALTLFTTTTLNPDTLLYNTMFKGLINSGRYNDVVLLYAKMREFEVVPDGYSFPLVVKACGCFGDVRVGEVVHGDVVRNGYELDCYVGNALVGMYGKFWLAENARKVFDGMSERSVVSWNAMIGVCGGNGRGDEGVELFKRMVGEGVGVNRVTVVNVMGCVSKGEVADEVYRVAVENGVGLDCNVRSAAILMYARCKRIGVARGLFDGIVDKDLVCWTSMIEAYVQADLPVEALEIFNKMILAGVFCDIVTLLGVVRACVKLGSFEQARMIHGLIARKFPEKPIALETSLVDLYVKCGNLVYARNVFDQMRGKNVISWSTMILGYGLHGHGGEAVCLFNQMRSSIKPDSITFVSVLSACSHSGLVAEGWELFNAMERDFRVTPQPEHYACMVDLLGRAGKLIDALEFIERMPIRQTAGVWGALLGACRIHRNIELAEVAAKSLFDLDAANPGRYVLLSNIYASAGKKQEADRVRDLMIQRRVKKIAGYTQV